MKNIFSVPIVAILFLTSCGLNITTTISENKNTLTNPPVSATTNQNIQDTARTISENKNAQINSPISTTTNQNQNTQATGLKTYRNPTSKFSLQYPADWTVNTAGGVAPEKFSAPAFDSPCQYEKGDRCTSVMIEASPLEDQSKRLEPDFLIDADHSGKDTVTEKTIIKVDNEDASVFNFFQHDYSDSGRVLRVLVTSHKNMKYRFMYEESQKDKVPLLARDWQNKKIFDQMVESFKFLE